MTMWGADVDQLDGLAGQLVNAAATFDAIRTNIGAELGRVNWTGSDAQQGREQWQRTWSPALASAAGVLRECSNAVKTAAQAQRQASDAVGGGINGVVGPAVARHEQSAQVEQGKRSDQSDISRWLGDATGAVHTYAEQVARFSGDMARIASDSSTVLEVGALALAVVGVVDIFAGVVTLQPEVVALGFGALDVSDDLYDGSEALGTVATGLQDAQTVAQGDAYATDVAEQVEDRGNAQAENQATSQAHSDERKLERDVRGSVPGNLSLVTDSTDDGGDE